MLAFLIIYEVICNYYVSLPHKTKYHYQKSIKTDISPIFKLALSFVIMSC